MDAKEAKRIAEKANKKKEDTMQEVLRTVKEQEEQSVQDKINKEVKCYLNIISNAAKKGETYLQTSYPDDNMYPHIKKALESKGYRVGTFTTDEGYCIGDREHMSISW